MRFILLLVAQVRAFSPPPCSLNGVLVGGACVCDAGWTGALCNELRLLPAAPLAAASQPYFYPSNAASANGGFFDNSWGISVLPDDDDPLLWHGFVTNLQGNCSLSSYSSASRILHVVSSSPTGPFAVAGVALPAFAHNPQVVRDVDGAWLLYHIGDATPPDCDVHCVGGRPSGASARCSGSGHGTSVARATSPWGPWERLQYILPDNQTNPSALVLSNGTIVVTARRWTVGVPIYVASSWRGPYVMAPLAPVVLVNGGGSSAVGDGGSSAVGDGGSSAVGDGGSSAVGDGDTYGPYPPGNATDPFDEDAFLYTDSRGGYHMVTHRQPLGTSCSPTAVDSSDCRCGGGHMFATDLHGPWFVDAKLVFNCTLVVAGASEPLKLHARQRPTLLRPRNDAAGCPTLFTGASSDPVSQYYSSFTMAQQVDCGTA